jgi:LysM repeat protein
MSKAKLSASEWELVRDAPYWVNAALAAADGRVAFITSRLESQALSKAISTYRSTNALVRDIVANESNPAKEIKDATESSAEKALSQIATVVEQKLGTDDLDALGDFLLHVGQTVAEAAGEGVLGMGDKVSKKEAAALEGIAAALKATEADKRHRQSKAAAETKAATEARAATEAKVAAEAKAAAETKSAAEAKAADEAKAAARAREEAEKVRMKAEQGRREARDKAREDALAKEEAAREAAARPAEEVKAQVTPTGPIITEHKVVSGDNLSMISQKYYGTQANWRAIYEANKAIIGDNPNLIRVGQVLKIPKL